MQQHTRYQFPDVFIIILSDGVQCFVLEVGFSWSSPKQTTCQLLI